MSNINILMIFFVTKVSRVGRVCSGGRNGNTNMKELCCKRKTAVRHADEKNVVETRHAVK